MHSVVMIKSVPDTMDVRFDPETKTMIRAGVATAINPFDLYAIEEGLRLRERHGGQVTVMTMGPPAATRELQEAIAMGCDDAILLSDRAFAGADTWATAYTLARGVARARQSRSGHLWAAGAGWRYGAGGPRHCPATWLGAIDLRIAGARL